jgi:hypothetical protein
MIIGRLNSPMMGEAGVIQLEFGIIGDQVNVFKGKSSSPLYTRHRGSLAQKDDQMQLDAKSKFATR